MDRQIIPRIPTSCPPAFQGRYTVRPGDTMWTISQMFRVRFEGLVANNPHITNPNVIYPGDVLCIPGLIAFPCCITLREMVGVPLGTAGAAIAHIDSLGTQAVSVVATLPRPNIFGNYTTYRVSLIIPEQSVLFDELLFPTPEDPPTYSATISLPTAAQITPNSRIVIQPYNTLLGRIGPVILQGFFNQCR